MKTFFIFLEKIEDNVTVVLYSLMTINVLIAVFLRYVLKIPFPYYEELSKYMAIWATMIGFSICVRRKAHLGIELLVTKLPSQIRKILDLLIQFVALLTYIFLTYYSYRFTAYAFSTKVLSPALRLEYWVVYMALPVGFGLSTLRTIQLIWNDHFSKEKNETSYEEVNVS